MDEQFNFDQEGKCKDKTTKVGTYFYRSPEIEMYARENKIFKYTDKVDIYSLGIIFFEMWHPFPNKQIRHAVLYKLHAYK